MGEALYRPLGLVNREIRVISIDGIEHDQVCCSMKHVALDTKPEFDALSYTWGPPTITRPISVNGATVNVTVNLEAALRQFHKMGTHRSNVIWIDAICINQSDLDEKNHQVPLMAEIYSCAITVFAWLGESNESTGPCFDALRQTEDLRDEGQRPSDVDVRKLMKAYILAPRVVLNPYWSRIWVVQELVLAENLVLLCGEFSSDMLAFLQAMINIWKAVKYMDLQSEIWREEVEELGSLVDPRHRGNDPIIVDNELWTAHQRVTAWAFLKASHMHADGLSMLLAFDFMMGHLATNPLDKVYALLGLVRADIRSQITVDYRAKPMEAFREAFALIWTSEDDLVALASFDYATSHHTDGEYPSWVPDLCHQEMTNIDRIVEESTRWNHGPKATISQDKRYILSHGIIIDTIAESGSLMGSISNRTILEVKRAIFEAFESGTRPKHLFLDVISTLQFLRYSRSKRALPDDHRLAPIQQLRSVEAPWRFLTGNNRFLPTSVTDESFSRVWDELFLETESNPRRLQENSDATWREVVAESIHSFCREANHFLREQVPITTSAGFIGVTPPGTKGGDCVVILRGFNQPIILRPHEQGHFTVVGRAHVSGIMDFDALEPFLVAGVFEDKVIRIG